MWSIGSYEFQAHIKLSVRYLHLDVHRRRRLTLSETEIMHFSPPDLPADLPSQSYSCSQGPALYPTAQGRKSAIILISLSFILRILSTGKYSPFWVSKSPENLLTLLHLHCHHTSALVGLHHLWFLLLNRNPPFPLQRSQSGLSIASQINSNPFSRVQRSPTCQVPQLPVPFLPLLF